MNDMAPKRPFKAYEDAKFLKSPDARTLRILAEYLEPANRFRRLRVNHTVVFFGSSRILSPEESERRVKQAELQLRRAGGADAKCRFECDVACRLQQLSKYYSDAMKLAEKITRWSMSALRPAKRFYVCSGGGPGIMEAANRGARNAGGRSVGLNISLPFEQLPNKFQSDELSFEFHYFFMRKYWFAYLAKALVVFPGGFGTMDELFEMLTLRQTGKIKKRLPTLLYGADYWRQVTDIPTMVDWGTISERDLGLFHRSDSVDDAFDWLVTALEQAEAERKGISEDTPRPERRENHRED